MTKYILFLLILCGCGVQVPQTETPSAPSADAPADSPKEVSAVPTPTNCPVAISIAQVSGDANRNDYPLSATIDGNISTFMTTVTLHLWDVKNIAYELANPADISRLDFYNDYTGTYAMGDLAIQTSIDSIDGVDGTWTTLASLTAATNDFVNGTGSVSLHSECAKWVRLQMTYNGTGASGGTPSFYLSEVRFH